MRRGEGERGERATVRTLVYPAGTTSPFCTIMMSVMGLCTVSGNPNMASSAVSAVGWSSTALANAGFPDSATFANDIDSRNDSVCEQIRGACARVERYSMTRKDGG